MAGVRIPIRIRSIDAILREEHGSVRQLTVDERKVLRSFARAMELYIEDHWPVDTGDSRDGWRSQAFGTLSNEIDGIGILIVNLVSYTSYVRRSGELATGAGVLWIRLVTEARDIFRDPLLAAMREEIRQTEARLAAGADFLDILQQSFRPRVERVAIG